MRFATFKAFKAFKAVKAFKAFKAFIAVRTLIRGKTNGKNFKKDTKLQAPEV